MRCNVHICCDGLVPQTQKNMLRYACRRLIAIAAPLAVFSFPFFVRTCSSLGPTDLPSRTGDASEKSPATTHKVDSPKADEKLADLAKKYRISIIVKDVRFELKIYDGVLSGKAANIQDLTSYLRILDSEWRLYPVDLITRSNLRRIVLCSDLSFAGLDCTGLPDFGRADLYLNVSCARDDPLFLRKCIHHEFFHIIDYQNGTLGADERWSRLLPKGVKYGKGGRYAQDNPEASWIRSDLPGFLNTYSMSGVDEDKAEVFANMVANSRVFKEMASRDIRLRKKAELMKEFLQTFCPSLDDSFWDAARKLRRGVVVVAPTS